MTVLLESELRMEAIQDAAKKIMTTARTAPKGKGQDNLVLALLDEEGIKLVSDKMKEMVKRDGLPDFFLRDAVNILSAQAMVVFGTRIEPMGLGLCGMCGFANCGEKSKHPNHPCVFNTGDLGIAMGSAASMAMDCRIDNRIMYTVGQAILEMQLLDKDVKIIYGMPLSISGKNPFMDRKMDDLLANA